mmetsp:Transcript_31812/g.46275  ORF Transcript_31812/g.46275 Transcript_31812/m.46275 type:complete len:179 (-) Transcript_31812:765-1301(-)
MVSKSSTKITRKRINEEIAGEEVSSDKLNFTTDNRKSVKPKRLIDSKAIFSILEKARPWENNHTKSETLDILWKYVHFFHQHDTEEETEIPTDNSSLDENNDLEIELAIDESSSTKAKKSLYRMLKSGGAKAEGMRLLESPQKIMTHTNTILGKTMLSLQPIRVETQWMIYLIMPLKK